MSIQSRILISLSTSLNGRCAGRDDIPSWFSWDVVLTKMGQTWSYSDLDFFLTLWNKGVWRKALFWLLAAEGLFTSFHREKKNAKCVLTFAHYFSVLLLLVAFSFPAVPSYISYSLSSFPLVASFLSTYCNTCFHFLPSCYLSSLNFYFLYFWNSIFCFLLIAFVPSLLLLTFFPCFSPSLLFNSFIFYPFLKAWKSQKWRYEGLSSNLTHKLQSSFLFYWLKVPCWYNKRIWVFRNLPVAALWWRCGLEGQRLLMAVQAHSLKTPMWRHGGVVLVWLHVRWGWGVLVLVRVSVGARRGRRLTAVAGCVGVQHLQKEVVHQHHVPPLHGGQMVHAFVTAERSGTTVNLTQQRVKYTKNRVSVKLWKGCEEESWGGLGGVRWYSISEWK